MSENTEATETKKGERIVEKRGDREVEVRSEGGGNYSPPSAGSGVTSQPQVDLPPSLSEEKAKEQEEFVEQQQSEFERLAKGESPVQTSAEEFARQKKYPASSTGQAPATATNRAAEGSEVDYSDYTVAELKDMAQKRGVEVHSDMLKDDIIAALKKADKAG